MPDEPTDVTPVPSPGIEDPQAAPAAGTAAVPVTTEPGDDRPVQNVVAEFNRKFGKLQDQITSLTQYIATQQQPPSAQPAGKAPTDDELWSLAQQGDRSAFELYMHRIADRRNESAMQVQEKQRITDAQLQLLASRYPVFNDAGHPLTQAATATYQMLVGQGYPAGRTTLLDAIKTAIADRPDIVAEMHAQGAVARETSRVSAARRAQAGATGTTVRQEPAPAKPAVITPQEAALAQRMGVKDPAKSKERFWKRQETGGSAVEPRLAAVLNKEET